MTRHNDHRSPLTAEEKIRLRDPVTEIHELTFLAERAGLCDALECYQLLCDGSVCPIDHVSPLVREGCVYGLARHTHHKSVRWTLQFIAINDPSETVRQCAVEALEEEQPLVPSGTVANPFST